MTNIIATNITSPIGLTTEENFIRVRQGDTAISPLHDWNGIPGRISVGIFPKESREALMIDGFSWYESLVIHSIKEAAGHTDIDFSSDRLALIIATTKGNVEALDGTYHTSVPYTAPGVSAKRVAQHLHITTEPMVICNACISGATAQVMADRLISHGVYDTVIVCGADTVNKFCLAGFTSFKSMSPYPCRPFDIERLGLNIGECASTVILSKKRPSGANEECWQLVSSHLDNDAYHISAPAPDGDGVYRAIINTLPKSYIPELGSVCAHGTATMFNDQMESKAIDRAGLSEIPVSAYKGIYGHTFGAAGVIEAALAMRSLEEGIILPVTGFEEAGVSGKMNLSNETRETSKRSFIKILSGFGGCNAAIFYSIGSKEFLPEDEEVKYETLGSVRITPEDAESDSEHISTENSGAQLVTEVYKSRIADNNRFYKMDTFSRLMYVATGLLLNGREGSYRPEDISMLIFNQSSSIAADTPHIRSFSGAEGFYPSPALFINTLPNVVMGEIAARHHIKGETTLVILPDRNERTMEMTVLSSLSSHRGSLLVTGWVDCSSDTQFEAELKLLQIK